MVVDVTHGVVEAAGSVEEADEPTRTNLNSSEQSRRDAPPKCYRTSRVAESRRAEFQRPTIPDGRAYSH
jgi:hypothetical protein